MKLVEVGWRQAVFSIMKLLNRIIVLIFLFTTVVVTIEDFKQYNFPSYLISKVIHADVAV